MLPSARVARILAVGITDLWAIANDQPIEHIVIERPQHHAAAARAHGRRQQSRLMRDKDDAVISPGSSRTFSSALAALRFISSAASTTTTRQPPRAAELARKVPIRRTSSTTISVNWRPRFSSKRRSTVSRSGCAADATQRKIWSSTSVDEEASGAVATRAGVHSEILLLPLPHFHSANSPVRRPCSQAKQGAGDAEGPGRLANSPRAADQQRVAEPSLVDPASHLRFGTTVTEQQRVGAGRDSRCRQRAFLPQRPSALQPQAEASLDRAAHRG